MDYVYSSYLNRANIAKKWLKTKFFAMKSHAGTDLKCKIVRKSTVPLAFLLKNTAHGLQIAEKEREI